ncbi:MAG: putative peptidase [Haloplasmataceae bacterium]|nr:putative peptidase [Haloplasmataceae bacterium]
MKKTILSFLFLASLIFVLSGCDKITSQLSSISTTSSVTTGASTTTTNAENNSPVITINAVFQKEYEVGSTEPNWLAAVEVNDEEDGQITLETSNVNKSQVNMNQVGQFDITFQATDSDGNNASKVITIKIVDTTKPVILGLQDLQYVVHSTAPNWLEGISATDNLDGPISLSMNHVDSTQVNMTTIGTFIVTYSVSDSSGNTTIQTITVTIIENPKPVITIKNEFQVLYEFGSSEPNWLNAVEVNDHKDGPITIKTSNINTSQVNMNEVGQFDVNYEVTDTDGFTTTLTLTVTIVDTTKPVFLGLQDLQFLVNSPTPDWLMGVSATDNVEGQISLSMTHVDTTQVNMNSVGTFSVTYTVTDQYSNTTVQTITVSIVEDIEPVITLNGNQEVNLYIGQQYVEEGATATLNGIDISNQVIRTGNVDINVPADYFITYKIINEDVDVVRIIHVINDLSYILVDDALEQAIRNILGYTNEPITLQDVQNITSLDLNDSNISHLSGLEYFTNVNTLNLSNNNIVNISVLQEMYINGAFSTMPFGFYHIYLLGNPLDLTEGSEVYQILIQLTSNFVLIDIFEDLLNEDEGNDIDHASLIEIGEEKTFYIHYPNDIDCFKIVLAQYSNLSIYTSSNLITVIEVVDEMGNIIQSKILGGIDFNARLNITLTSGTYYILITHFSLPITDMFGEYKLTVEYSNSTNGIHFDDPNLEAAIREELNEPIEAITEEDLLTIGSIDLSNKNITDLSGIDYLKNMTTLILSSNSITDLTPISQLTHLKYLILDNNEIIDISPLSLLINLKLLTLSNNLISDISPLVQLNKLELLMLSDNKITDIGVLLTMHENGSFTYTSNITNLFGIDIFLAGNPIDISIGQDAFVVLDSLLMDNVFTDINILVELPDDYIEVALNTTSDATFDVQDHINCYMFTVTELNNVILYTTGDIDTTGNLFDIYGNIIDSGYDNSANENFIIQIYLIPGTYYINVESSELSNYQFHIEAYNDNNEIFEDGTPVTIDITNTINIQSQFDSFGDEDYYIITVTNNSNLLLYSESDLDTYVELYDEFHNQLTYDDDSNGNLNFRILYYLTSGTYYLKVSEFNDEIGSYEINFRVNLDDNETFEQAVTINLGSSITSQFDYGYDKDYYHFTTTENMNIILYSLSTLDTYGFLYDANQSLITEFDEDDLLGTHDFRIIYYLTPGTYYLKVEEFYGNLGSYEIYLIRNNDQNEIFDQAVALEIEANYYSQFDYYSDKDYYTFEIVEDKKVIIYTISALDTYGYLYDANKNLIIEKDEGDVIGSNNFRIEIYLTSGTYYIAVEEYNYNIGDYQICIKNSSINNDQNESFEQAVNIDLGTSLTSQFDNDNDTDFYRFTTTEAMNIMLYSISTLDTYGYLYDANQNFLNEFDEDPIMETSDFRIIYYLTPGTYYLKVEEFYGDLGIYEIYVKGYNDQNEIFNQAVTLEIEDHYSSQLDYNLDKDYYTFEIVVDKQVVIYTMGSLDTYGSLYDSNKNLIVEEDEGDDLGTNNFRIEIYLTSGTYYIAVEEYNYNTGDYQIFIENGETAPYPDDSIIVNINSLYNNQFNASDETDTYVFTITESMVVLIYTTGDLDTYAFLYDYSGDVIESNDDSTFENPGSNFRIMSYLHPGTYYIEVRENYGDLGAYQFHLETFNDNNEEMLEGEAITIGINDQESISSQFNYYGDKDYYIITVTDEMYVMLYTVSTFDTLGTLFDSQLEIIVQCDDDYISATSDFRILYYVTPGTYYLKVDDYYGDEQGNYSLFVEGYNDFNEMKQEAVNIEVNDTVSSQLDYYFDEDYYSFTLSETTYVTIYSVSSLDTIGNLYDSNDDLIVEADNYDTDTNDFKIEINLLAGTYYIKIKEFYGNMGNYELIFE